MKLGKCRTKRQSWKEVGRLVKKEKKSRRGWWGVRIHLKRGGKRAVVAYGIRGARFL